MQLWSVRKQRTVRIGFTFEEAFVLRTWKILICTQPAALTAFQVFKNNFLIKKFRAVGRPRKIKTQTDSIPYPIFNPKRHD